MTELIKTHRFRRVFGKDPLTCAVCGMDFGLHSMFPYRD